MIQIGPATTAAFPEANWACMHGLHRLLMPIADRKEVPYRKAPP